MPALSIPEHYRKGVAAIGALSEGSFVKLFEAIKASGQADSAESLAAEIKKALGSSARLPLVSIISALAALKEVRRSAHVEPGRFASDVWSALQEDAPELIRDIEGETLKSRIVKFVSETDIHLTSVKANQLKTEVERAFCGARILTDMRAAFADDASKSPLAMAILHTLEIKYHDDLGRHREFYISMDDDDLATLKDAIERAEKKKRTLSTVLGKADIKIF